jgi:DNA-binding NarL/FixJ family response regulator
MLAGVGVERVKETAGSGRPAAAEPDMPGKDPNQPLRVIIVGDDPDARQGLRALVEAAPNAEIVAEAATGTLAAEEVRDCQPDLLLFDVGLPRMAAGLVGEASLLAIARESLQRAGAGTDPAAHQRPGRALTRREREIMGLIAEGRSNRQIADLLVLSPKTVKNHICRIYQCMGVHDRDRAVRRWEALELRLWIPALSCWASV